MHLHSILLTCSENEWHKHSKKWEQRWHHSGFSCSVDLTEQWGKLYDYLGASMATCMSAHPLRILGWVVDLSRGPHAHWRRHWRGHGIHGVEHRRTKTWREQMRLMGRSEALHLRLLTGQKKGRGKWVGWSLPGGGGMETPGGGGSPRFMTAGELVGARLK